MEQGEKNKKQPKILTGKMQTTLMIVFCLFLVGILFVDLMQLAGVTAWLTKILRAPVEWALGLPADATPLLLLGFLRKDVSIALLEPFNLTPQALVVACVFMSMYMPCIATFFVMLRETGWKDTLRVVLLTLGFSVVTAIILRTMLM